MILKKKSSPSFLPSGIQILCFILIFSCVPIEAGLFDRHKSLEKVEQKRYEREKKQQEHYEHERMRETDRHRREEAHRDQYRVAAYEHEFEAGARGGGKEFEHGTRYETLVVDLQKKNVTQLENLNAKYESEYIQAQIEGREGGFDYEYGRAVKEVLKDKNAKMSVPAKFANVAGHFTQHGTKYLMLVAAAMSALVMNLSFTKMMGIEGGVSESWERFLGIKDYKTVKENGVEVWDLPGGALGASDLRDICGNYVDTYTWDALDGTEQKIYKDNGMWGAPCLSKWIWSSMDGKDSLFLPNRFAGCILGSTQDSRWSTAKKQANFYNPITKENEIHHFFKVNRLNYDCHGNIVTWNPYQDVTQINFKKTKHQKGFYFTSPDENNNCITAGRDCLGFARKPKACQYTPGMTTVGGFPLAVVEKCYEPLDDWRFWKSFLSYGQFSTCKNKPCQAWTAGAVESVQTQEGFTFQRPHIYDDKLLKSEKEKYLPDGHKPKFPSMEILRKLRDDFVPSEDDDDIMVKMMKCGITRDYQPWDSRPKIDTQLIDVDPLNSQLIPVSTKLEGWKGSTNIDAMRQISDDDLLNDYIKFVPYVYKETGFQAGFCSAEEWIQFLKSDPNKYAAAIRVPVFELLNGIKPEEKPKPKPKPHHNVYQNPKPYHNDNRKPKPKPKPNHNDYIEPVTEDYQYVDMEPVTEDHVNDDSDVPRDPEPITLENEDDWDTIEDWKVADSSDGAETDGVNGATSSKATKDKEPRMLRSSSE